MAFCRSVFLLALSVICVTANSVPVFLWGDLTLKNVASNPLSKVNFGEFNQIVRQELKESPFTVIFIEETLSVEDFSHKNSDGSSLFPYLQSNLDNIIYLPSVESALRVLNKVADPEKVDHVKLTENGLSAEIKPEGGQFIFINLKDAKPEESRNEMLKRHNDFMEDMFSKLKERYENVVGVYTAHYPSFTIPESYLRVRRQAETQSQDGMYVFDGVLLYVKHLELSENGEITNLTNGVVSVPVLNGTELEATLTFGERRVAMVFDNVGGYWLFNKVQVTRNTEVEEMMPVEPIYAIEGFSYRCGQSIVFESVNTTRPYSITFTDVKLQPYTENATVFGESLNCVGFFSVPIWSGLFVVFILLSITFYGIMMMMDIRSMDRFDDPKGKTITINTSE